MNESLFGGTFLCVFLLPEVEDSSLFHYNIFNRNHDHDI